ncbi:MAG TPA: flavin reductase family protein [Allosphingosinicella sp.]|nr:flavin reductase family protein [Allosphingosinicella sp.]
MSAGGHSWPDLSDPLADRAGYRKALGRFPTGVAFVATRSPDGRQVGMLINSFASVSLDPPLVLWSIGLESKCRGAFVAAPGFAISILSEDQRCLIEALGRPHEQRLEGIPVRKGLSGAPVLDDAAAAFECATHSIRRAGDHEIIIGKVERFERRECAPLAFLAGKFGCVNVAA